MNLKVCYLLIAASVLPVMGADAVPYVGLEVFLSNSTGSLKGSFPSSGSGLGVFVDGKLRGGFGYIWDISCATSFSDRKLTLSDGSTANAKFDNYGTTLSGTYHVNKQDTGLYVLAGLGARRFQGTINFPASTPPPVPKSGFGGGAMANYYTCDTGVKLAYLAGVGFDFSKQWGVMVRYQGINSLGHTLATVESGVEFRF